MDFTKSVALNLSTGGTVGGDLIVSGDLTVDGNSTGNYDEIVNGNLQVADLIATSVGATTPGSGVFTTLSGTTSITGALTGNADTATTATNITVADESTDTTCFPLFATAATGNLPPKSGSNLTFNSSTGLLTSTLFAGALTGNVTGNASGTALTVTQAAQTAITSVGTLTGLNIVGATGESTYKAKVGYSGSVYMGLSQSYLDVVGGNHFHLLVNGSEKLTVLTGGNVGIGTASPTNAQLEIAGSAADKLYGSRTGSNGVIRFAVSGDDVYIDNAYAGDIIFRNTGEIMRLETAGNVGIGTASPNRAGYNGNYAVLTLEGKADNYGGIIELVNPDSATNTFGTVSFANLDGGSSITARASILGVHGGADDASALTFATEATGGAETERMRIDSSGNVGIGVAAPHSKLHVFEDLNNAATATPSVAASYQVYISGSAGTTGDTCGIAFGNVDGTADAVSASIYAVDTGSGGLGDLAFATSNASEVVVERMRILSGGNVGIGIAAPAVPLHVYNSATSATARVQNNDGSDPLGIDIYWSNAAPNDTTQWFVQGRDTEGDEFKIYADGSFSQISDISKKENITDVDSMISKINDLRVVNYNRKNDEANKPHIGIIAQELEDIFPHLISKNEDDTLMVYKIGLVMPLIKAVQELSAKVTALENA